MDHLILREISSFVRMRLVAVMVLQDHSPSILKKENHSITIFLRSQTEILFVHLTFFARNSELKPSRCRLADHSVVNKFWNGLFFNQKFLRSSFRSRAMRFILPGELHLTKLSDLRLEPILPGKKTIRVQASK